MAPELICDLCCQMSNTVRKSTLEVHGVKPSCQCDAFRLCKPCRDELVARLQA